MIPSTLLLITLFTRQDIVTAGRRPRFEPLHVCPDCVPREDIVAAGVGFDLTTSYATAAIRFHDGSIESLVKVRQWLSWRARANS